MESQQQAKDLRSFLADVKARYPEELITVERDVDLRFEISALLVKLDRAHKFPVTMFTKLRDVDGLELTGSTPPGGERPFDAGELGPGGSVRGNVGFQVRPTARGFILSYEPATPPSGYRPIRVDLRQ